MRASVWTWGAVVGVAVLSALAVSGAPAAAKEKEEGWLGVYSQELDSDLRESINYKGQGVLVRQVVDQSPAARAGLQRGDVIVRVDSKVVDSPAQLADAVQALPVGKKVPIEVVRDGSRKTLNATLAARPVIDEDEAPVAPNRSRWYEYDGDDDHDWEMHVPGDVMSMGRGRLGVRVETLNPDLASYFGSRDAKGALVIDVTKDSPADKAGIRPGDVITKVGGHDIETTDDVVSAVRDSEGKVSVWLLRHGNRYSVEPELEAPTVLRLRHGPGVMMWKDGGKEWKELRVPSGSRRIVIDGDDLQDQLKGLRDDMNQLREELRDLEAQHKSTPAPKATTPKSSSSKSGTSTTPKR
jgi:membrane-associated protease RseP (regulator of RpoE activity)